MQSIIFLRGLPASGKSSYALELLRDNSGKYKRVNKDFLRKMIDGGHWSKENEGFILHARDTLVREFLAGGFSVIVDDTNLKPDHEIHMREIANEFNAEFVVKEFDITVDEAIARDAERKDSVGEKVIFKMYNQYVKKEVEPIIQDPTLPSVIICDIDGTIAKMCDRDCYDHAKAGGDKVNRPIEDILYQYTGVAEVIFMSGRDEEFRGVTEEWLTNSGIKFKALYMRPHDDKRSDDVVKKELFEKYIKNKFNVLFCLDDRSRVVRLWRSMGLTCLQVNDGYF